MKRNIKSILIYMVILAIASVFLSSCNDDLNSSTTFDCSNVNTMEMNNDFQEYIPIEPTATFHNSSGKYELDLYRTVWNGNFLVGGKIVENLAIAAYGDANGVMLNEESPDFAVAGIRILENNSPVWYILQGDGDLTFDVHDGVLTGCASGTFYGEVDNSQTFDASFSLQAKL